ncbi:LacI family DNA-binding transcriptional regulator [Demequina zhanjiangensis]|uniref:LacI family DNA-binding transcriptional regulator n=1 Tax=Demequina zhanjiangensis TaxID=3051659 RepID=A0ABT8G1K9_9MICO|nr:LacI family DNA-binding transcriptional regulator [Demequina sp. SYSU T00b26]MDN4473015.1 LacI family DNA-binding transcriptional regulator [Demequina sp. SYSU T00b26]
MPDIGDVARLAGVSNATVSRALSGRGSVSPRTQERVREAARELGYAVSANASGLASGKTANVGVVVPFLSHWFYTAVIEGAQAELTAHGYDVTLYNLMGSGDERRGVFERSLARKRVDAVIAVSLELTDDELGLLRAVGKPVVGVGGPLPGSPSVAIDDVAVARLATSHLIALGHRTIAHLGGDPATERDFHVPSNRRQGYEAALNAAGIPVDPQLFHPTDFTIESGYASAKRMFADPDHVPTAIVAASDEMAIGALLAARDLGVRVPQDLSIVGIDGHGLAEFFGLTTVAQYPERQGKAAAEAVMRMMDGDASEPTLAPVEFDLVVRSSTARPARSER